MRLFVSLIEWLMKQLMYGHFHATRWIASCFVPIFTYRMIIPYWHYLRFRHAVATIIASQVIVALFVIVVIAVAAT